ncbi:MAG: YeeE/YedE family protein [Burkholderiales bacterium]|nr:YeeE/YedE family protein [Burkholderiales bacterium]
MNEVNPAALATTVAWSGFALAFIFGAVANKTNFCTMGAVSDMVNMGDWGRMRMWLLAIAVAVLGASALQLAGLVQLSKSIYMGSNFPWLSYLVGGLTFGIGMTLGSGCGSKTLIRIGGGSLKSLVVFVFLGISAYVTLRGLFGAFRVTVLDPVSLQLSSGQDLPSLLAAAFGADKRTMLMLASAAVAGVLLLFVFKDRDFRGNRDGILGGVTVGLVVVGGWFVSGKLGYLVEDPNTLQEAFVATNSGRLESLSFVAPQAYTLELLMFWTDTSKIVTFGIASAIGVVTGSAAYALASGNFRWESFRDAKDTGNHMIGGVLMGFGGVTAMGCTVGQGITGFSTLAIGSMFTLAAIIAGSALTMKWQYARMMREA